MFEKFRLYQLANDTYVIAYRLKFGAMWRVPREWEYPGGSKQLDYTYLDNVSLAYDGEKTVKEAFDLLVRWFEHSKLEKITLLKKFYSFKELKKAVENVVE